MPTGVYIRTPETRKILSLAKIGKKLTPLHRLHIKQSLPRGEKHYMYRGIPKCIECGKRVTQFIYKYCRRCASRGSRNHAWKGGITPKNRLRKFKSEYKEWRKNVFERDNYTCVLCGDRGVELNADHIKSWAHYPELRYNLDNGRTLCVECHKKTPNYKGRKQCPTQFIPNKSNSTSKTCKSSSHPSKKHIPK